MSDPVYGSAALTELALNLRWTWNHAADELWGRLDPELWELTQNPWVVLADSLPGKTAECIGRSRFPQKTRSGVAGKAGRSAEFRMRSADASWRLLCFPLFLQHLIESFAESGIGRYTPQFFLGDCLQHDQGFWCKLPQLGIEPSPQLVRRMIPGPTQVSEPAQSKPQSR